MFGFILFYLHILKFISRSLSHENALEYCYLFTFNIDAKKNELFFLFIFHFVYVVGRRSVLFFSEESSRNIFIIFFSLCVFLCFGRRKWSMLFERKMFKEKKIYYSICLSVVHSIQFHFIWIKKMRSTKCWNSNATETQTMVIFHKVNELIRSVCVIILEYQ